MAAVDTSAGGGDGGDVDYAAPGFFQHVGHGEFGQDEGAAEVDGDCVVPFFDADVEDAADSFPVAGIHYYNIRALAMLLVYLGV